MRSPVKLIAAALLLFSPCVACAQSSNLIVNGNFEEPVVPVGGWTTFKAPETFAGWKVTSGGVDITSTRYFASRSGQQSVDLNSTEPGAISQTVATQSGEKYLLTFAFAGNPIMDQGIKVMEVWWNKRRLGTLEFDTKGRTGKRMDWKTLSCSVTGTGSDKLTFQSSSSGCAGPAIDKVSLTVLPASSDIGEKLSY